MKRFQKEQPDSGEKSHMLTRGSRLGHPNATEKTSHSGVSELQSSISLELSHVRTLMAIIFPLYAVGTDKSHPVCCEFSVLGYQVHIRASRSVKLPSSD